MDMQPKPSDTTIRLPVTFDYQGGRRDSKKSNIITTAVLIFAFIAISLGTLRSDKGFFEKCLIIAVIFTAVFFWLRFKVYHEATYSDAYESLVEVDYIPSTRAFWGIYEVDDKYPYIAHFKNGKKGIFVQFDKDVVVGKPETVMFDHYNAIGDAYKVAGSLNIDLGQIDYMDNIGNDPRLSNLFGNIRGCVNPDLKDILFDIFSNLQNQMSQDYASYDVYLFTGTMQDEAFWYNVGLVIEKLSESNYITYKVLNEDGMRVVAQALFNLKEFSAKDACANAFASDSYVGVVPIALYKDDGTETIYNKTSEEKRIEAKQKLEEAKKKKAELKARPLKEKIKSKLVLFIFIFNIIKDGITRVKDAIKVRKMLKEKAKEHNTGVASKSEMLLRYRKEKLLHSTEAQEQETNINNQVEEPVQDNSNEEEVSDNVTSSESEETTESKNDNDEIDIF